MKKIVTLILTAVILITCLSSCSFIDDILGSIPGIGDNSGNNENDYTYSDFTPTEKALLKKYLGETIPFIPNNEYYLTGYDSSNDPRDGFNLKTVGNTEEDFNAYLLLFSQYELSKTYDDENGHVWYQYVKGKITVDISFYTSDNLTYVDAFITFDSSGDILNNNNYTYQGFSASEKEMFDQLFGGAIPFLPNNEYYVEAYAYDNEIGINFYTFGNTESDFDDYLKTLAGFTFIETYQDIYDDTWYSYKNGDVYLDISYYTTEDNEKCVDIYVFIYSQGDDSGYTYTEFTSVEKSLFQQYFGAEIPFIATNDYYLEEYTLDDEYGLNYYTFGNTRSDFDSYLDLLDAYSFVESFLDSYGDVWYTYEHFDFFIDISYYTNEYNETCIDVYIYKYSSSGGGNGGNESGSDIITNEGVGLPEGSNGVYDIDFEAATNVKNVSDQGYYIDGCPTVGAPGVLVIPVDFSDSTAESKGYTTSAISDAFGKGGVTDYYSVYDYYYISSYGKLSLDITVLDFWFRPKYNSGYYQTRTMNYNGSEIMIGDQIIMDEALAYLSELMDLSKFDSDSNGIIDAVVLINTLDIGDDDFHWAYRYWNFYTDNNGYYYEYDNVSANDYMWASYQFLYEGSDLEGNIDYTNNSNMNTYTYIHEFGHILGSDDYYDTAGISDPLGGCDVMDAMLGDHNAFTKFNFGWITSSRLVTTESSVTLSIESFSESGDSIILANNWDPTLGAYQEYYIITYYRSSGLNSGLGGYFSRDGIVVYHVNSSLYKETIDAETYYDIYNNNTDYSDDYGTKDNLIEYVVSADDTYTYIAGDSLPTVIDDSSNKLNYTFEVIKIEGDTATLTFTKLD